jgi:hypothetical protein
MTNQKTSPFHDATDIAEKRIRAGRRLQSRALARHATNAIRAMLRLVTGPGNRPGREARDRQATTA